MVLNITQVEKLWSYIQKGGPDDCWPWVGEKSSHGYGRFRPSGKKHDRVMAHRAVSELTDGPIPEGIKVLHKCDNPPCCNPNHLFRGTQKDNSADCVAKGRHKAPRGENHGEAKLTAKAVLQIRSTYKRGVITQAMLGKLFGVSERAIDKVLRRENWKHVV